MSKNDKGSEEDRWDVPVFRESVFGANRQQLSLTITSEPEARKYIRKVYISRRFP